MRVNRSSQKRRPSESFGPRTTRHSDMVVTGNLVEADEAFELLADQRIVRLPYWFYLLIC